MDNLRWTLFELGYEPSISDLGRIAGCGFEIFSVPKDEIEEELIREVSSC